MEESSQTIVQNPASTQQCVSYRYSTTRFIFSSITLYFSLKWCAWPSLCIIPLALLSSFTPVAILWYYLLLFSSFLLLYYISSEHFLTNCFPVHLTLCYTESAAVFVLCQDQVTPNFSSYCPSGLALWTSSARQHDVCNPARREMQRERKEERETVRER